MYQHITFQEFYQAGQQLVPQLVRTSERKGDALLSGSKHGTIRSGTLEDFPFGWHFA
jgi:hypothetical protein